MIYANHLKFTGADAPQAIFKAIGAWLKEQLGYGPRPDDLRSDGRTFSANDQAGSPKSWVRVHAARDLDTEICAWLLKHPDEDTPGRQWIVEVGFISHETKCLPPYDFLGQ